MQNLCQRLPLVVIVLLAAAAAVATPAAAQTFTEFPIPYTGCAGTGTSACELSGITTGPDGALWFTEYDGNQIGRITTAGVITEFQIPTLESYPSWITAGPDGNLWFTESGTSKIGCLSITATAACPQTTGKYQITEFPVPTQSSAPEGITAGPNGNLWFADEGANKIGRITTAGAITEFPIPTGEGVAYITAGPDGALWFTELFPVYPAGCGVGRITTAGVITEFEGSKFVCELAGITAGSDGALWFADTEYDSIGRVTTAGGFGNEFSIPLNEVGLSPGVSVITTGPDGALWFTENDGDRIGRITTAGVFTIFGPTPTANSAPFGITTGPDGALWFAEEGANKIGRLAVTVNSHDFNGDGYSDIAWRDTSGDNAIWLMNGGSILSSAGLGNISTAWSIVGQRDFNGDGKADLLWHDTSGDLAIWFMNGTTVSSGVGLGTIPTSWTIQGAGAD